MMHVKDTVHETLNADVFSGKDDMDVADYVLSYDDASDIDAIGECEDGDINYETREVVSNDDYSRSSSSSSSLLSSPEPEKLRRTNRVVSKSKNKKRRLNVKYVNPAESDGSDNSSQPPSPVMPKQKYQKRKALAPQKAKVPTKSKKKKQNKKSGRTKGKAGAQKRKVSQRKTVSKAARSTKTKIKPSHNEQDNSSPSPVLSAETGLFVPPLKLPKLPKERSICKQPTEAFVELPSSQLTTTSILLSMMAQALNVPKYTSVHTVTSPTSADYPDCPTRSSWPLLRQMISTPSVSTVSISPAPRQTLSTVLVEPVDTEEPKPKMISKLSKEIKCECKFNKGKACWLLFDEGKLGKERLHHLKLKRESLDLVILAKIAANINRGETIKKKHGKERQRCRLCYYHEGRQICRETFLYIHGICKGRLSALVKHYKKKGLSTRIHGNKANIPHHALSHTDSERVLDFIRDYANEHCVSSFGRKPGSKAGGGLLIMSPSQSKLYVHHKYKIWSSKNDHRAVSLRSFQNLWTKHLPYIVVLRGSNKTPVPEPGSHEALMELHEGFETACDIEPITATSTTVGLLKTNSLSGQINGPSQTNRILKVPQTEEDNGIILANAETNTHIEFGEGVDGRKKRKRKALPPRKVETPSIGPPVSSMTDRDFVSNHIFDESQLLHTANNNNTENMNISPLSQSDLHHSNMFNNFHIPSSSSNTSHPHHHTTAVSFQNRPSAAPMMLTANKDMLCSYVDKPSVPVMKTSNLRPSLYLPQPSQLLDSYSMHCPDRFAPHMSSSHSMTDQSQPVILPHQGTDFSNMHQIDWQTWQSYS